MDKSGMNGDMFLSHPHDIASFALNRAANGKQVVVIFVTAIEGGSVRVPGLRMAVDETGHSIGYVSNGCIEADIIAIALSAIEHQQVMQVAYGRGSGKIDIVLPCGGRVELAIVPLRIGGIVALQSMIASKRDLGVLSLYPDGNMQWKAGSSPSIARWTFQVVPKIRLHVIGIGSETLHLARLAMVSDFEVQLHSPDRPTLEQGEQLGLNVHPLMGLSSNIELDVDPVSAVALMFHDHEWETGFLQFILQEPVFYIGALGSYRAHQRRIDALIQAGCSEKQIARIRAPIGIVQKLRDPNLLAASVVAEIVAKFQDRFVAF